MISFKRRLSCAIYLLIILSLNGTTATAECPNGCTCVQKTVRCVRARMRKTPSLTESVEFLDLRQNYIKILPQGSFRNLSRLTFLSLNDNGITTVENYAFYGLDSLQFLYMANNEISELPQGIFDNLRNLETIYLDRNRIKHIQSGLFSNLPRLHRISLFKNNIQMVESDGFSRLPKLTRVRLDENPIMCDCGFYTLWEIFYEKRTQPGTSLQFTCASPAEFSGRTFSSLHKEDFDCGGDQALAYDHLLLHPNNNVPAASNGEPQFIRAPSNKIIGLNGPDVTLDCVASGNPIPEIQWFFNNRPITQSTDSIRIQTNGSLVINEPTTEEVAGLYRCEARNPFGSIQADARVEVRDLPIIFMAPHSQQIKIGEDFILECDAEGHPMPMISWQLNGQPIVPNQHVVLENENTELMVKKAKITDTGLYLCVAENENGKTIAEANITIEDVRSAPRLVIEPVDLKALVGTTIELPCQSNENEGVQIIWRRDGRLIDPNVPLINKYEISGLGSLFVKNVTVLDSGRYECSVKNEYGRATASALVTIVNNEIFAPGDQYVRIAFEEAAKDIDMAISNTIEMLFANQTVSHMNRPDFSRMMRVFRFPTGQARQLARAAEIYERTLVNIRKHVRKGDNLTIDSDPYEFRDLLSREHLHLVAELSGCMEHREMPNCTDMCYHSKYRSIDGTCNNLQHPTWGASLIGFQRIAKPIYENGFSMPIGWTKGKLYAGYPKPSARLVSTTLISTKEITADDMITHMVMQWGQFVDHDLDHAIPSVSSESWDGVDCKKTCEFAPPCYSIEVPPNDPRIKNRRCIDVVRSSSICGSGMTSIFFDSVQYREQINQLTAFIDASQVYGYSYPFSQELRNLTTDDGLLRVGVHFPGQKDMLPFAAPQDGMDCRRNLDENTMNCFVAGDIRVNEQVGLLAMHTIWLREHNRIATKLREVNPHWDGDTIYQESRKIVGGEVQHITFKHWLPKVIGEGGMQKLGEYRGYDPNVNPTILNEFATAAFRFGHTLINPILHRLDSKFEPIEQGHLQLHKAFFAPWRLAYEGGVDALMRGMFAVPAKLKTPDQNLNTELTEKLFQTAHAVALDLAAINVQRGRDHGIPGYNVYRKFCNMTVAETFDDLQFEISSADVRRKLKDLYGHPDNIDIFVGGILEDQIDGGKVGPLFQCIILEQFRRIRDGDRFYYEKPGVFLPQQLEQIKQASLARVLCDNGDNIKEIGRDVFILPNKQGGYTKCEEISGINLFFWQDCGSCSNMPELLATNTYVPQTYIKPQEHRAKRDLHSKAQANVNANENNLEALVDIAEDRVSNVEQIVSKFQKELQRLQKKVHRLEKHCEHKNTTQHHHAKKTHRACIDKNEMLRLDKESWEADKCTECTCEAGQITCVQTTCSAVVCEGGIAPISSPLECCPRCLD